MLEGLERLKLSDFKEQQCSDMCLVKEYTGMLRTSKASATDVKKGSSIPVRTLPSQIGLESLKYTDPKFSCLGPYN
jgi:hypothetical protein